VKKAMQAGALYGGREPSHHGVNPLRFRLSSVERLVIGKDEKG
jgi:hypothetical protein